MESRSRVLRDPNVPVNRDFLTDRRDPWQPELIRDPTFVHRPGLCEGRCHTMRSHEQVKVLRVLHAPAHQVWARHRTVCIRQHRHSPRGHSGKTGEFCPGTAFGETSRLEHRNRTVLRNQIHGAFDKISTIDWRRGIGHEDQSRDPTMESRRRARSQRLFVLVARLAGVYVKVEHPRDENTSSAIDHFHVHTDGQSATDLDDHSALVDENIGGKQLVRIRRRDRAVLKQSFSRSHSSQSLSVSGFSQCNTAIRTAIPFSTCVLMRLFSYRIASSVISTPRLTGPGCIK